MCSSDLLKEFSNPQTASAYDGVYIIVPHQLPRPQIPSTENLTLECKLVTEMWLERCLDAKSLVPPESHITNTPLPRFPIPGKFACRVMATESLIPLLEFRDLKICSTGFIRIDLLHMSKLVKVMGKLIICAMAIFYSNHPRR